MSSYRNIPSKIVCRCNLVSAKEIEKVMDNGYYLLEDISNITGASKSCGRCKPILQKVIDQHISSLAAWQTAIDWDLATNSIKQKNNE